MLNEDNLPIFEGHGVMVEAILSDNGREFCGSKDCHPYNLLLLL